MRAAGGGKRNNEDQSEHADPRAKNIPSEVISNSREPSAGALRRRLGVFYTPPQLASFLVAKTLDPLIDPLLTALEGAISQQPGAPLPLLAPFQQLAALTICDPAMGGGIFLVEALRYFAHIFWRLYPLLHPLSPHQPSDPSQDSTQARVAMAAQIFCLPEQVAHRRWLEFVLGSMLYGVDLRPESCEDAIRTLLTAFRDLSGAAAFTKSEASLWGQRLSLHLIAGNSLLSPHPGLGPFPVKTGQPMADSMKSVWEQVQRLAKIRVELASRRTAQEFAEGYAVYTAQKAKITRLIWNDISNSLEFSSLEGESPICWEVEFPEVFAPLLGGVGQRQVGFGVILCNPPWYPHQLDEQAFFARFDPEYPSLNPRERAARRKSLLADVAIRAAYEEVAAHFAAVNAYFGREFPLQQERKFNLFKLFLERGLDLLQSGGRAGWLVPLGLFGEARAASLRGQLFTITQIRDIYHCYTGDDFFPAIAGGQPFALFTYTLAGGGITTPSHSQPIAYYPRIHTFGDLQSLPAPILISSRAIAQLSPHLRTTGGYLPLLSLPLVASPAELALLQRLMHFPRLRAGWGLTARRELNRTDDLRNGTMAVGPSPGAAPVLEGKHLVHYGFSTASARFFILHPADYGASRPPFTRERIVCRNVSNIRLRRRVFCALIPPGVATVNSLNYICVDALAENPRPEPGHAELVYLLAMLGSLAAEFQLRAFSSNNNLNQYLLENLAVPPYQPDLPLHQQIVRVVEAFIPHAHNWASRMVRLGGKAAQKGALAQEFWSQLANIDALCLEAYGLNSGDLKVIRGKFPGLGDGYFALIRQAL